MKNVKWTVRIIGESLCLEDLSKHFNTYIIVENNNYLLKCEEFDSIDDEKEVFKKANELLSQMANIVGVKVNQCNDIRVYSVSKVENGITYESVDVGELKIKLNARASVAGTEPPSFNHYLTCLRKHDDLNKAFRLFNNISEDNKCHNLYKVYEIIRDDLGGEVKFRSILKVSKNEMKKFTRTMNHICGEGSRHSQEHNVKPMPLTEAHALIRDILLKWIELKCKGT